MSLRGPATQHLNPRPKAEFDGTGGRVGRVDGLDGPEKCPLNFFKLCGHLEFVYIHLYTK
jgi:hypothetical protein